MTESQNNSKSEAALREERILKFWQENKIFEKTLEKESSKGEFVFYEGPPTANAKPALHHLEARAFKDVIPRYKTMQGFHVPRRGGWDTHGLPVELQIEKKLGLNSKKEVEAYGIEKFNKECRDSVFTYIKDWEDFTDRIGYWVDKDKAYFTFDNSYIESLWNVLSHVNEQGLLYKDYRIVPWCARCGTPLASHELAQGYQDVKDLSIFVKFLVNEEYKEKFGTKPLYILAWTTTPWTLPGNVALAVGSQIEYAIVNHDDGYYFVAKDRIKDVFGEDKDFIPVKPSDLIGLKYKPLYNFITPNENSHKVYAADFVTTEDGTGIVHIAPMYGQDDFELGTKEGLPKEHVVGLDGKFVEGTGFFEGRFAMEKDEAGKPTLAIDVIRDLQARGLFFDKKNYEHNYPHCWRCKTPLIYYARDSWYIQMSKLRDELVAQNQNINWEPSHIRDGRFGEWLKDIKDWAISRERYWGTPLPIWMSEDGEKIVVDSLDTLKKYSKDQVTKIIFVRHGQAENNIDNITSSDRERFPLTDLGLEQAKNVANILESEDIDVIYSSPIKRAKQTAQFLSDKKGIEIIEDDRLGEIMSGSWENKSLDDPSIKDERDAYRNLSIEEKYKTKRGGNGESWKDLEDRVTNFIEEVLDNHKGKTIVCFAHQGTNGSALGVLKKLSNEDAVKRIYGNLGNGSINPVFVDVNTKRELDLHRPFIDDIILEKDGKKFTRVKEVMDVWFDSGAMPFAQDHYPFENKEWIDTKGFPGDFISEAIDQTRGWFYTLHAVGVLMGRGNAYKNVICLGHILDKEGKKMSKSVGNIVNPWEMMDKYGVDTLRLWMYSVNQPGESKNFDEKTVSELHNKVFNLFYNVLAFYELYRDKDLENDAYPESSNILDKWILARLSQLVKEMTENLDRYKLLEPVRALRDFIDDLSTWYLRRSRDRLKDGEAEAKKTLYYVLKQVSVLMAPFAPFSAEDVWQKLKLSNDTESVHLVSWPEVKDVDEEVLKDMKTTRELVTAGLEQRQKAGIKVRQPLSTLEVAEKLSTEYLELIKEEVNVKEVGVGKEISINTEITPELKKEGDYREFLRSVQGLRKDLDLSPEDMVSITIPENQKEVIAGFEEDFKKVAGIKEINWGEEIKIEK